MTSSTQPVVLLVHGAWHQPLHYRRLINALRAEGQVVLAPPLASAGYDDSIDGKTMADDVRRVHETLLPYLDKGNKVVVAGHSYGGVVATEAVHSHTVAEREARGLPGGVVSVVYIAAAPALQAGISMYEAAGGQASKNGFHDVVGERMPLFMDAAPDLLYNGAEESVKSELSSYLCEQSRGPWDSVINVLASQIKVPKTYVVCKEDRILPLAVQTMAADAMEATVVELDFGHCPFAVPAGTAALVKIIIEAAKQ